MNSSSRTISSSGCSTSGRCYHFLRCRCCNTGVARLPNSVAVVARQSLGLHVGQTNSGTQARGPQFLNVGKQQQRLSNPYVGPKSTFIPIPFTLTQLMVLKAIATAGSFDDAAQLMSTSPINLRVVLSTMEKTVGMTLIEKSNERGDGARKRLTLTPAGELLMQHGNSVLLTSYDLLMALKDFTQEQSGTVYIGASQTSGVYVMPKLIESFKRKRSKVCVHLQVDNTARCCRSVASGDLEMAVVGGAVPQDLLSALQVQPYREEDIVLIVSPSNPVSQHPEIHKTQLSKLKFVSLSQSSTLTGVQSILENNGIQWQKFHVVMEVNSFESIKNAVKVNLGVAFVPRQCVEEDIASGSLAAITISGVPLSRTLSVVTPRGRYSSRAVREFIHMLAEDTRQEEGKGKALNTMRGNNKRQQSSDSFPPLQLQRFCPIAMLAENLTERLSTPASPHPPVANATTAFPFSLKFPFTVAQLAAFRCVAHSGSTKAASLLLAVSQPNVSKLVSTLEASLNMQLITKHSMMRCHVTEAGQLLLRYTDRIMDLAADMSRGLEDLRGRGVVRVGGSTTPATYLITKWIGSFRQANPTVAVRLSVDSTARIVEAVADGKLDIAVVEQEIPDNMKNMVQVTEYAADEVVLVCGRDHVLAGQQDVDVADLSLLTLLALAPNTGDGLQEQVTQLLEQQNVHWPHMNVEMELTSLESLKLCVQHGVGCAFLPAVTVEQELALGLIVQLNVRGLRVSRTLHLISSLEHRRSPAAAKFVQQMFRNSNPLPYAPPSTRPWPTLSPDTP